MKIRVHTKSTRPFRRAGIEFGREPVILDTIDLTDEQSLMLQAEPMLVIEHGEEDADGGDGNGNGNAESKSTAKSRKSRGAKA